MYSLYINLFFNTLNKMTFNDIIRLEILEVSDSVLGSSHMDPFEFGLVHRITGLNKCSKIHIDRPFSQKSKVSHRHPNFFFLFLNTEWRNVTYLTIEVSGSVLTYPSVFTYPYRFVQCRRLTRLEGVLWTSVLRSHRSQPVVSYLSSFSFPPVLNGVVRPRERRTVVCNRKLS